MHKILISISISFAIVMAAGTVHAATPAGKIVYAFGQVEAVQSNGARRALKRGDVFGPGDTVVTRNGRTQLRFTDGGRAALQPNTEYRIEDYHFEGSQDGNEKSFMNLVRGSVRLVTGLIGRSNKRNFRLRTAVATIGIRGTAGKISHCDSNCGERGPGTSLSGYDGIWDLSSGSYNGPVRPGQAKFCNGASCFDIPGFGQRRDVNPEAELDPFPEESEETKPLFVAGEQSDETGISCEASGNCGADLVVTINQSLAAANRLAGDPAEFDATDAAANVAVIFNNGVPTAIGSIEMDGTDPYGHDVVFATNDPAALRQALMDYPDPAVSAKGLAVLDAVDENLIAEVNANPASVAEEDYGFTSDGLLLMGRFQDGNLLDIEANTTMGGLHAEITTFVDYQSAHFIFGPTPAFVPLSGTATYGFTGSTDSTSLSGATIGNGVTQGTLTFNFASLSGSINMNVNHNAVDYSVTGSLIIEPDRLIFFDQSVYASTGINSYFASLDGFFAHDGDPNPLAAGLAYEIQTPDPIMGAAGFGLQDSASSLIAAAPAGQYIAFANAFTDNFAAYPNYSNLNSNAFDFLVNGDTATLTDGIPSDFNSSTHAGLCSPCTFGTSGGPAESGSYAPLGVSWGRFVAGTYSASNNDLAAELGSAHVITIEVPTDYMDVPDLQSGKTGTYTILKGNTSPTVIFETGGIQQSEVVGTLDSALVQVVFNDGSMNAVFTGSWSAGSGGSWNLAGSESPGAFNRTNMIHAIQLTGSLTSSDITDTGFISPNDTCAAGSGGCTLFGHTHFTFAGAGSPTAVAGSVQGNTSGFSEPEATVAFGYLLEGSVTTP